jgi:hypothetical protein
MTGGWLSAGIAMANPDMSCGTLPHTSEECANARRAAQNSGPPHQ